ncbi:MAG: HAD-IIIA family hydrolase [Burkholderiaceae bacterium]|nr:MAG: HAD-IIIA family hydrolase [Burkholderiaceae bacterium]
MNYLVGEKRHYDLLVFDWDGTLMDSTAVIVTCIQNACRDLDIVAPSNTQARYVIGLGLQDALTAAVPNLPPHRYSEMVERYRHHYLTQDHALELFEGAHGLLLGLKAAGYQLAVATGKSRAGLSRALDSSALRPVFDATRCADETFSKPHPEMLLQLMDELDTHPARTLMIGDTTHDVQMAHNAGVAAIGLTQGAHPADALLALQPLACLPDLREFDLWLRQHG